MALSRSPKSLLSTASISPLKFSNPSPCSNRFLDLSHLFRAYLHPPPHTTPHFSGLNFVLKVIIRRFDDSLVFSDAGRMDFDCGFRLGVLGLRILLRDQSRNKSGVHG